jgi:hypothetical protein
VSLLGTDPLPGAKEGKLLMKRLPLPGARTRWVTERIALSQIRNQKKKRQDRVSHFKTAFGLDKPEEKIGDGDVLSIDHTP